MPCGPGLPQSGSLPQGTRPTNTMQNPRLPLPVRRVRRAARLACGAAAWLLLGGLPGRVWGVEPAGATATKGAPAATSLESLLAQVSRQQQQVQRLEGELQAARRAQAQAEQAAAQKAQAIEQLKSEAPGVARDLRLQELLAQAQAQAGLLSQQASELRARETALRSGREQLVLACDQLLAADGGKLPLAQRLGFLRLRTAQVEALHGAAERDSLGQAVRTVVQAGAALSPEGSGEAAGGDDPRALRERADLLRDSADKLHREVQRLKLRSEELGRRQRLRERAARVDEDLFAEQTKSRHVAASSTRESTGATALDSAPAPAPQAPGSTPLAYDSAASNPGRAPDPSTLDVLQRVESLSDPVAKLQALQRAQAELGTLTEQLLARAARLEHRAAELARQK